VGQGSSATNVSLADTSDADADADADAACVQTPESKTASRLARRLIGSALDQWWQAPGAPADSEVRKLLPQPHADTAFGLLTVKPAPISVSR
jgi:hypothetical protein